MKTSEGGVSPSRPRDAEKENSLSYTDDAVFRRGILEGVITFLQKPFTTAALFRKVREVLDAP